MSALRRFSPRETPCVASGESHIAPPLKDRLLERAFLHELSLQNAPTAPVGVHYTPVEIAREVVQKALRPIFSPERGAPRSLEEVLSLKIYDPAMGAGIFLIEACDQIAALAKPLAPEGFPLKSAILEHCLFGTDVDTSAVALAKTLLYEFAQSPDLEVRTLEKHFLPADSLRFAPQWECAPFDLVLGNPPFLGGRKIRRALGDDYFHFLTKEFAPDASGNADYCAYFFRLAEKILKPGGICAFVATNTLAEGDSRKTGLDPLLRCGAVIYDAKRVTWTSRAAVQTVSIHLQLPGIAPPSVRFLDDQQVPHIFSSLKTLDTARLTRVFPQNRSLCYQGFVLAGSGFILSQDEARTLLALDERHKDVILPYFTGEEIFSTPDPMNPTPKRWVIHFHDWSEERAQTFPILYEILRQRVFPHREKARRIAHRRRWWLFGDNRPALSRQIVKKGLAKLLLQTRHTKFLVPTFVPADAVYSESTVVFPSESLPLFALLNSFAHDLWARETSSSIGTELRYVPTDCFYTFPFPRQPTPLLLRTGRDLLEYRTQLTLAAHSGLTPLYTAFHDPKIATYEIKHLRDLHEANERALLESYGWSDLATRPNLFDIAPRVRGVRLTYSPPLRVEILHRLQSFALNMPPLKESLWTIESPCEAQE
ncbi:MAG: N-6 DNA methylase [Planctomycetia bacterium]|nr:N-6 DNA methylase [Planctomycetia bacterium]